MEMEVADPPELLCAWKRLKDAAEELNSASDAAIALGLWWEMAAGVGSDVRITSCAVRLRPLNCTYSVRLPDSAPATHIGKRPSPSCEHVWHADGDYDRCDLCHGQKKREPL